MAKRTDKNEKRLHYPSALRELKEHGPGRLYLLWGPEDYLREDYLGRLKKLCLPEGEDSFSYRRLDGPELESEALRQAVDALPFLTERSFVELRGVELNRLGEADKVLKILRDIPEYCTVAFVQSAQFEPDGRLKFVKGLREIAEELKFTQQPQGMLLDWISRRFAAAGKSIELEAAQRLIFISGDLMNRLIPEIEKIAAYARGDRVTTADVEAVANHIPEAVIFDMTDQISKKQINAAIATLAELLSDRNNEPIPMLAMLGVQMRKLYAARLAIEQGLGARFVMDVCGVKYEYVARMLLQSARGFTLPQLKAAVVLCAETDYRIKSSGMDDRLLLQEAVLRIAAGECDAQA